MPGNIYLRTRPPVVENLLNCSNLRWPFLSVFGFCCFVGLFCWGFLFPRLFVFKVLGLYFYWLVGSVEFFSCCLLGFFDCFWIWFFLGWEISWLLLWKGFPPCYMSLFLHLLPCLYCLLLLWSSCLWLPLSFSQFQCDWWIVTIVANLFLHAE